MAKMAGGRHMRAAAEIDKTALPVKGHRLIGRNGINQFNLERLVVFLIERHRLITAPDLTRDGFLAVDNFMHAGFNRRKVIGGKRRFTIEIIIEAVFDGRADRHLRFGIEFEHSLGHDMRRIMAQQGKRIFIARGDNRQISIFGNFEIKIDHRRAHARRQCSLGQSRPDISRNLSRGNSLVIVFLRPVGQGYDRHVTLIVSAVNKIIGTGNPACRFLMCSRHFCKEKGSFEQIRINR